MKAQARDGRMPFLLRMALAVCLGAAPLPAAAESGGFARVIEGKTFHETLRLEGPEWNDTLVRDVVIRGAEGNGILLRGVRNVRIESSTIEDVSRSGIHLSARASTRDVRIVGNRIARTGRDGISSTQRRGRGVDHPGLVIADNVISETGLAGEDGLYHGIYVQSTDFLITGNRVSDSRDGNGISVRSSGVVRGNVVIGTGKSGIAYYSDHMRGGSDRLVIEGNTVADVARRQYRGGIDLLDVPDAELMVHEFVIRDNRLAVAPMRALRIDSDYRRPGIRLRVSGNRLLDPEMRREELARGPRRPPPPLN